MSEVLFAAEKYLREEVAPKANEIDRDPEALRQALQGLCDRKLMALRRPLEYGGPGISESEFRQFQEMVARISGSLAFLQTQHQSAVSMISKSENEALKAEMLPDMADKRLVGIGFSQLRRPGAPILRAEETQGGYVLNGHVPWVTGHGFYGEFLIGATLPGGEALFGIVPFENTLADNGGSILFDGPMRLAAMESPQTMTADLTNWFMPSERVAFIKPDGWIQTNDTINVTLQAWFALGCARAGLDLVQRAAEKRGKRFLHDSWQALDAELVACRAAAEDQARPLEERLQARAWAIDLAARCAHAGVIASSGAANSLSHNAQRVYREALVYSVSAQTEAIMEASLNRLVSRGSHLKG